MAIGASHNITKSHAHPPNLIKAYTMFHGTSCFMRPHHKTETFILENRMFIRGLWSNKFNKKNHMCFFAINELESICHQGIPTHHMDSLHDGKLPIYKLEGSAHL